MVCQVWQSLAKQVKLAAEIEKVSLQAAGQTCLAVKLDLSIVIVENTWVAINQANEVYYVYVKHVMLPLQVCLEESQLLQTCICGIFKSSANLL